MSRELEAGHRGPDHHGVWTTPVGGMGVEQLSPPLQGLLRSTPRQDLLLGYWHEILETSAEELRDSGRGSWWRCGSPGPPTTTSAGLR